jgi:hypothetical protein
VTICEKSRENSTHNTPIHKQKLSSQVYFSPLVRNHQLKKTENKTQAKPLNSVKISVDLHGLDRSNKSIREDKKNEGDLTNASMTQGFDEKF